MIPRLKPEDGQIGIPCVQAWQGHQYSDSLFPTRDNAQPTHIAFPTDAESLAQMRERIEETIGNDDRMYVPWSYVPVLADAVMRLLFGS